jgi:hypothetical protein
MSTRKDADALEIPRKIGVCEKRRYVSPVLVRMGSVRELTGSGVRGSHLDGVPFHHKNKP